MLASGAAAWPARRATRGSRVPAGAHLQSMSRVGRAATLGARSSERAARRGDAAAAEDAPAPTISTRGIVAATLVGLARPGRNPAVTADALNPFADRADSGWTRRGTRRDRLNGRCRVPPR